MASKFKVIPLDERPKLYRYGWEDGIYGEVTVQCRVYVAYAKTDCSFKIIPARLESYLDRQDGYAIRTVEKETKRVLSSQYGKRFAYLDQLHALRSYIRRKKSHIRRVQCALEKSKAGMQAALDAISGDTLENDSHRLKIACEYFDGWAEY